MIQSMNFNTVKPLEGVEQYSIAEAKGKTPAEAMKSFGSFLSDALDNVAAQEQNVQKVNDKFLVGEVSADQVMIASEQALLSLQLTTQVRNKVIEAYQEIMRTQI
ncbi:flagellar hook-basal body complex protein FliE [Paenibacillus motobuensis]|uniref:flagellar hook-basal body complex protein FliE n=1 Tax=Paenibacillus TaxID=44249 RepID=UPI00203C90D8|nr:MULTISPECIES: flagellar hook-basal body complex protein FliE [Paenibacillus]MCM3038292.1 flagellar hook-basal body complex protein FliE [Paenibacillus lutimineralis]MCM3645396.1 flagellar hook-basal body complex protein FliE [Paenibacillus motobuensis]